MPTTAELRAETLPEHNRRIIREALKNYESELTRMLADSTIQAVGSRVGRNGEKLGRPRLTLEK